MTLDGPESPQTAEPGSIILSIQFLRAVAALMVLIFHTEYMIGHQGGYIFMHSNAGAAGVDVFFIVSGFIIAYVTRSEPSSPTAFLLRRLIRVLPSYWFYTTLMLGVLATAPFAFLHLRFDLAHVAMSYGVLLSSNNEGVVGTLLGVGWTICFEVYFYALVAAFMLVPRRYRTAGLSVVTLSGAILEHCLILPPFTAVFLSALPLEFLAGYLFAKLYLKGWSAPGPAAIGIVIAGAAAIYAVGLAELVTSERDPWRVLYFGVPALCLVIGVVSLEVRGWMPIPAIAIVIGSASYSLYLSHQFILYAIGKVWSQLGLQEILPTSALLIFGGAVSIGYSILAYLWFELPMTRWLNTRWSYHKPIA